MKLLVFLKVVAGFHNLAKEAAQATAAVTGLAKIVGKPNTLKTEIVKAILENASDRNEDLFFDRDLFFKKDDLRLYPVRWKNKQWERISLMEFIQN